jgi:hypothetical protein
MPPITPPITPIEGKCTYCDMWLSHLKMNALTVSLWISVC